MNATAVSHARNHEADEELVSIEGLVKLFLVQEGFFPKTIPICSCGRWSGSCHTKG